MKRHFWAFMAIVCLLTVQNTQGQQMVLAQKNAVLECEKYVYCYFILFFLLS